MFKLNLCLNIKRNQNQSKVSLLDKLSNLDVLTFKQFSPFNISTVKHRFVPKNTGTVYLYRYRMNRYIFQLNISYQQFLASYSGAASKVQVITTTGLRLQLPATRFRPFLTQIGVRGQFRLTTDQKNKFIKLEAL